MLLLLSVRDEVTLTSVIPVVRVPKVSVISALPSVKKVGLNTTRGEKEFVVPISVT